MGRAFRVHLEAGREATERTRHALHGGTAPARDPTAEAARPQEHRLFRAALLLALLPRQGVRAHAEGWLRRAPGALVHEPLREGQHWRRVALHHPRGTVPFRPTQARPTDTVLRAGKRPLQHRLDTLDRLRTWTGLTPP